MPPITYLHWQYGPPLAHTRPRPLGDSRPLLGRARRRDRINHPNVCFWHKADITRLTQSGHGTAQDTTPVALGIPRPESFTTSLTQQTQRCAARQAAPGPATPDRPIVRRWRWSSSARETL